MTKVVTDVKKEADQTIPGETCILLIFRGTFGLSGKYYMLCPQNDDIEE